MICEAGSIYSFSIFNNPKILLIHKTKCKLNAELKDERQKKRRRWISRAGGVMQDVLVWNIVSAAWMLRPRQQSSVRGFAGSLTATGDPSKTSYNASFSLIIRIFTLKTAKSIIIPN